MQGKIQAPTQVPEQVSVIESLLTRHCLRLAFSLSSSVHRVLDLVSVACFGSEVVVVADPLALGTVGLAMIGDIEGGDYDTAGCAGNAGVAAVDLVEAQDIDGIDIGFVDVVGEVVAEVVNLFGLGLGGFVKVGFQHIDFALYVIGSGASLVCCLLRLTMHVDSECDEYQAFFEE